MPRPVKCRRVCRLPETTEFSPRCERAAAEPVIMTVDEFEALRLIDSEGLSQEDAAGMMNVARTTVQMIYMSARKKSADAIVYGRPLKIEGGAVEVCAERGCCMKKHCMRARCMNGDNGEK